MSGPSIGDVVGHWRTHLGHDVSDSECASLLYALTQREQAVADVLRLAGQQFGMYPQIVAEILAEVELGEPISQAQRIMVREQFNALMEQIAAAQRGDGPMPQP